METASTEVREKKMAQFVAAMGELKIEVAYSEIEKWLPWSCVVRHNDIIIGSLGGTIQRQQRLSDQSAVQDAVADAVRTKFSPGLE